jgi:hypothetical protein
MNTWLREMSMADGLTPVDALELPDEYRRVLRPGEELEDRNGIHHSLPRWFLRVDSWQEAMDTRLTEDFMLWEFIGVDVREAPELRSFPRYVPCAVLMLATALQLFRNAVGTYVHIAANGGYRSPGHGLTRHASRHCWGTAANIYRVGDDWLESRALIDKYAAIARRTVPGVWIRPTGEADGQADDHLHLDLGYTATEPVSEGGA